jgi:DNA-binding transcriptional ArsR family regulator
MVREKYSCDCNVIHIDAVHAVLDKMLSEDVFFQVSEYFRVLGDQTRAKIIWALHENELCVCDLANVLDMTKSAISHQLGILRRANLVKFRREGKNVFYALSDDHVRRMIEAGIEHIHE